MAQQQRKTGGERQDVGRRLVSDLVRAQMGWIGMSGLGIERTGRVSRATVDRIKRGEVVSDAMLRATGDAIGLPRDFLLYVLQGNIHAIREAAESDPDLVRWTLASLRDAGQHDDA
jgi:hypothetical protein